MNLGLYQKKRTIAWILLAVMYLDLIAVSQVFSRSLRNYPGSTGTYRSKQSRVERQPQSAIEKDEPIHDNAISAEKRLQATTLSGPEPGQPEASSFKSAGTDNLVDLFTGNFSYNIPLADVDGYPINLFYNGGITMDQEASWVGLGWNINPGNINRNVRGIPDDFKGGEDKITTTTKIKDNITVGVNVSRSKEFIGKDLLIHDATSVPPVGIFYNNYNGLGLEISHSIGASVNVLKIAPKNATKKTVDVGFGMNFNLNSQTGLNLTPNFSVSLDNKEKSVIRSLGLSLNYNSRQGIQSLTLNSETKKYKEYTLRGMLWFIPIAKRDKGALFSYTTSSSISFSQPAVTPSISMPISNSNFSFGIKWGTENKPFLMNHTSLRGYFTRNSIAKDDITQRKEAFGYLHYQDANNKPDAMLDFNRTNDGVYTLNNPIVSIPNYTYDVYSISGEGTGGTFRAYRGDVGYIRDRLVETRDRAFSADFDIASGDLGKVGVNLNYVFTPNIVSDWSAQNLAKPALSFTNSNGLYQAAYFKNPGEKAIIDDEYINSIQGDNLVRLQLDKSYSASTPNLLPKFEVFDENRDAKGNADYFSKLIRKKRDKRTQVITYLTGEEAQYVGLDKMISYFTPGSFPNSKCNNESNRHFLARTNNYNDDQSVMVDTYRQPHHISQINVLQGDGTRYVYGIPVYNTRQIEASFSVPDRGDRSTQLISYKPANMGKEDDGDSRQNADHYVQTNELSPFVSSYLLSGVLSSDYVDVTGNGISDDDLGTAVKFNYTRVEFGSKHTFGWRTPFTTTVAANDENRLASFSEGLKTSTADQKAHYTYGERELWYLNSLESKNMIATFTISYENRFDGKEAAGEHGGRGEHGMGRLEKIDVYSKPMFEKYGTSAKPIKTVHFEYDHSLCKNAPDNKYTDLPNSGDIPAVDKGRLTLKAIWFTYNGNDRVVKNYYRFNYDERYNPNYERNAYNRWGSYKPERDNPLSGYGTTADNSLNSDYPYALQLKDKADEYAKSWNLSSVVLPSGAKLNVEYESDDYAYVQNRHAARMFKIKGFSNKADAASTEVNNKLYGISASNYYVYVEQDPAFDNQLFERYLSGIKQLYFKLFVKVPHDSYNPANVNYELIPVYAEIDRSGGDMGYGKCRDWNAFWIRLKPDHGMSPLLYNSLQFCRTNLPSKIYPGANVKGEFLPVQIATAIYGMMVSLYNFGKKFEQVALNSSWCKYVDLNRSLVRLNEPTRKRLGGDYRVKRITIQDNWDQMTSRKTPAGAAQNSIYGQEYTYTTKETINGSTVEISSGVASYEPSIGGEENPFREIYYYDDKTGALGPTNRGAMELPLTEAFFPGAVVGYSKVTVQSINNTNVKSKTGKSESEFYTAKDFPVQWNHTNLEPGTSHIRFKSNPILILLHLDSREFATLSQGFKVELNDMHGKQKRSASYGAKDELISFTEYKYKTGVNNNNGSVFNNNVSVIEQPNEGIKNATIGKEVEVMVDLRQHNSKAFNFSLEFNIDVNEIGGIPIPIPPILPPVYFTENQYRSAAVMKVINYYGIIDKVISYDKGSVVESQDLVYDGETGNVLLSKVTNSFNKPIYKFDYPARWANREMGLANDNIDLTFNNVRFQNGKITHHPSDFSLDMLESGDELYVEEKYTREVPEEPGCYPPSSTPVFIPRIVNDEGMYVRHIWAVAVSKDPDFTTANPSDNPKFIFVDQHGQLYNGGRVSIRIIRSGKRNLLSANMGSFTSLKDPRTIIQVNNTPRQVIQPETTQGVLQTAAITYKEVWKGDHLFRLKKLSPNTVKYVPLHSVTLVPTDKHATSYFIEKDQAIPQTSCLDYTLTDVLETADRENTVMPGSGEPARQLTKAYLRFDMSDIPAGSTILNAKFSMSSLYPSFSPSSPSFSHEMKGGPFQPFSWYPKGVKLISMENGWPQTNEQWKNLHSSDGASLFSFIDQNLWEPPSEAFNIFSNASIKENVRSITQSMLSNYHSNGAAILRIDPVHALLNRVTDGTVLPSASWFQYYYTRFSIDCSYILPVGDGRGSNNTFGCPVKLEIQYYNCSEVGQLTEPLDKENYAQCVFNSNDAPQCVSVYDPAIINPYTVGMLGCWRPFKSYAYYGDRKENTISNNGTATPLSEAGTINDYISFWHFATSDARIMSINPAAITATNGNPIPWKWASESTQYNSKGFELENTDPLDRFNSGIYGYNYSLPIAAANNARLREIAYDGFEDYTFENSNCPMNCPVVRHLPLDISESKLSTQEHHTGLYSIKGHDLIWDLPVKELGTETKPQIAYEQTVSVRNGRWVVPMGNGLTGKYGNCPDWTDNSYPANVLNMSDHDPSEVFKFQTAKEIDLRYKFRRNNNDEFIGALIPPVSIGPENYMAEWNGYIQVPEDGVTILNFISDDGMLVKADFTGGDNLVQVTEGNFWKKHDDDEYIQYIPTPNLLRGQIIHVKIYYFNIKQDATALMKWVLPGQQYSTLIPEEFLYQDLNSANGTVFTGEQKCIKPSKMNMDGDRLIDRFSISSGKKMVLGIWTRINDMTNCRNGQFASNIRLRFYGDNESLISEKIYYPSGPIVDGWQRVEGEFEVPVLAKSCKLVLEGIPDQTYWDDLRIHPFNSNMKSFVYGQHNLRLMAELDENNYASFFEYDDSGSLVRVKKETTRGVKTINETRSALQKQQIQ